GLFGELLDNMRPPSDGSQGESPDDADATDADDEQARIAQHGYELEEYRPVTATPRNRLERIVQLKSVNPLFGVFVADHLAMADDEERIAVIESVLDVPGTVARHTRMPKIEDMPPGTLATTYLDPLLLQRGLASPEELGGAVDEEQEEVRDK